MQAEKQGLTLHLSNAWLRSLETLLRSSFLADFRRLLDASSSLRRDAVSFFSCAMALASSSRSPRTHSNSRSRFLTFSCTRPSPNFGQQRHSVTLAKVEESCWSQIMGRFQAFPPGGGEGGGSPFKPAKVSAFPLDAHQVREGRDLRNPSRKAWFEIWGFEGKEQVISALFIPSISAEHKPSGSVQFHHLSLRLLSSVHFFIYESSKESLNIEEAQTRQSRHALIYLNKAELRMRKATRMGGGVSPPVPA